MGTEPTYEIREIEVSEDAQEWGCDVTKDQDDELHARYRASAKERLAKAYPDVSITHTVERRTSSGTKIHITLDVDEDENVECDRGAERAREDARTDVQEILGLAWQETCEDSGDLF